MTQLGTAKTGSTCAKPWARAHPATMYATATLYTLRRFSSPKKVLGFTLRFCATQQPSSDVHCRAIPNAFGEAGPVAASLLATPKLHEGGCEAYPCCARWLTTSPAGRRLQSVLFVRSGRF